MHDKIDFVIAWVDGNDKEWQLEKSKYDNKPLTLANSNVRYRDWDQLKYWFRGVEKYAPWVNKIYFVTCGQKPSWLNEKNSKLVLINHKDFIPEKYLPTFSANPIELNFNKIKGISNKFVYFNDDMFLINKVSENDFFKNNLPCDNYCEIPLMFYGNKDVFPHILVNDSELINNNFKKGEIFKNGLSKYFNIKYGIKANLKTASMLLYKNFSSFEFTHVPSSFLKETLDEVWEKEYEKLDSVCQNKFRNKDDVNQYIFKAWQFCTGKFVPRNKNFGKSFIISDNNTSIINCIKSKKVKTICLNDSNNIKDFEYTKKEINEAFESKFPNKSSFEK